MAGDFLLTSFRPDGQDDIWERKSSPYAGPLICKQNKQGHPPWGLSTQLRWNEEFRVGRHFPEAVDGLDLASSPL